MLAPSPADTAPPPVPWPAWETYLSDATVEPRPLPARASVLTIGAHPDDETIGVARLLADHDGPVRCVTLTAGEGCFGPEADTDEVRAVRLAEWSLALTHLGAAACSSPRWPDGSLDTVEREATDALFPLAAGADMVLAPWRHDPHPDHRTAGRIAARVARRAGLPLREYVVWTPYWLGPDDVADLGASLNVCPTSRRAVERRRAALDCFESQVLPRSPALAAVVPPELILRHPVQLLLGCHGAADS